MTPMGASAPRGLSLQARALRWLSQREHSRQELRVKLLRDFLLREIPRRLAGTPCAVDGDRAETRPARGRAA